MFGFRQLLKLSAVAATALIIASCGGDKPVLASKGNMIPEGSVMAVKLGADQLFNKALGDENSKGREIWNMGKSMASMSLTEFGELGKIAREILNDPAALGVRMAEPVVMSYSMDLEQVMVTNDPEVDMYIVALLDNKAAFEKVVDATLSFAETEGITATKEASDDFTHYVLLAEQEGSLDLGVSAESVVFRFKYGAEDAGVSLNTSMRGLFANGESARSEGLEAFYASEGEIAIWYDIESVLNMVMPVMDAVQPGTSAQLQKYMPMLANASFVGDLSFLDGQTVLGFQMFGSQEMKDYVKKYYAAPTGKFMNYLPSTSAIVGSAAIKNLPEIIEQACEMNAEYADAFEQLEVMLGIDREFLAGISGDIAFAIDGANLGMTQTPGFVAIVECNRNVWDFIQPELAENAEYVGSDMYNLMNVAYVAYNDGHIILADPATMKAVPFSGADSFAETMLAKEIENGGFVLNLEALPIPVLDMFAQEIDGKMTGAELLEFVNSVVISSYNDNMSAKLILNMGDKQHNILEKLVLMAVAGF